MGVQDNHNRAKKTEPTTSVIIENHRWKTLYIMGLPHFMDGA